MRIGVSTLSLFPDQIGGMETYVTNLLTRLAAIDHQHSYYLFVAHYNRALFEAQRQRHNVVKAQTLSLQGLRKRCRQFSWERTARETLKVLEGAASIGTRHRGPQL